MPRRCLRVARSGDRATARSADRAATKGPTVPQQGILTAPVENTVVRLSGVAAPFSARTLTARRTGVCGPPGRFGRMSAGVLLPEHRLSRQLDAVLIIDRDHLHLQDIADFADVFHLVDVLVVQLADVAQAVTAGKDLDERTK